MLKKHDWTFLQIMGFTTEEVAVFIAVVGVLSVIAQVSVHLKYYCQDWHKCTSIDYKLFW